MNQKQLWVIRIGAIVVLLMSLVPPWRATIRHYLPENVSTRGSVVAHEVAVGYAFLLAPPTKIVDGIETLPHTQQIDVPLLLTQWALVAAAGVLTASFLRDRAETSLADKQG
jgi:hypothetical protein